MIIDHELSWIHHIAVHFEKAMGKGHPLWISKINIFNTILQKKSILEVIHQYTLIKLSK